MSASESAFVESFLQASENVGYSSSGRSKYPPIRVEGMRSAEEGKVILMIAVDIDHQRSINLHFLRRVLELIGRGDAIKYS